MKFMLIVFRLLIIIFFINVSNISAKEIGVSWEFNEDGNAEGWSLLFGVSDLSVSNGTLKATASGWFPSFKGPEFDIPASDYGFIYIRIKVTGASSARFIWEDNLGETGIVSFPLINDTSFHEYHITVYPLEKWTGQIIRFQKFEISGSADIVGTEIEIDYIKVISTGFKPTVAYFKPLRTVLKSGEKIPLRAGIRNNGDRTGLLTTELFLPEKFQLVEGINQTVISELEPDKTDSLKWTVICQDTGHFSLYLSIVTESGDSSETILHVSVTDQYWQQKEFFLSAWSPPSGTDSAYNYYQAANFDKVLWLPPDLASVMRAEQYDMQYILRAGSILGEHRYLRATENIPPEELTPEDLSKLETIIEPFKDNEANWGYYITDEPNAHAFPNLSKVVKYIREKDPARLSFINLFPTYANEEQLGTDSYEKHIEQFIDIVKPELLSYDHYHFFNGRDGSGYFNNLGIIRKWAMRYDIPFCNIIQAIGYDVLDWRIPNENEHRWLVYSTLAYGAKAIIWFHWDHDWGVTGSPARDQLFDSIQKLNKEINLIGPVLLPLKSVAVYHTGNIPFGGTALPTNGLVKSADNSANLVVGLYKDQFDRDYLMLMNRNYSDSITSTVTLNYRLDDLQIFDVDSGLWKQSLNFSETKLVTSLRPGAGKLYKLEGEITGGIRKMDLLPSSFGLKQNYPNPFNPKTIINYKLAIMNDVELSIYNLLGQKVATLVSKRQSAGTYQVEWDAIGFASGIYYYRIKSGEFQDAKKMIFIR